MNKNAWLDQIQEDILEPDRPLCDPHHHLWDNPENPYLLPQLLADIGSGHNIVSTVFVECSSMYRAAGEKALQPVGETEFVNGAAATLDEPYAFPPTEVVWYGHRPGWFSLSADIPLHEAISPENAARAYTQVLKTK